MATTIDPRMISGDKTLRIDDARFAYLSAYQSQITFLSSINLVTGELDVQGNINNNGTLFSDSINNTNDINSDTGSFNSLTTNSLLNNNNITTTDITVTDNTTLVNLTATGNITTNFTIITADSNYTFSDADKSKVIHFDTTTTIEVSAIFPSTLSDGFNVGVINAGIGVIYLSGEDTINSVGDINSEIYTGFFVYKVNGGLFSIGNLE